jgi:hypothetical protein
VEPLIDLAPGAEDNPLAVRLITLIRESVEADPKRRRSFLAMKSTVLVVPFDTGDALTLRFDLGRLAVHDGNIGIPSVTLGVPSADLSAFAGFRLPRFDDFLSRFGRERRRSSIAPPSIRPNGFGEAVRLFASGDVKVYGLWAHPRTVYRLLRLLTPISPGQRPSPGDPAYEKRQ